jgi:hypothetical protein
MQQGSNGAASAANMTSSATLTDEQILGLEPEGGQSRGNAFVAQVGPGSSAAGGEDRRPEDVPGLSSTGENASGLPDRNRQGRPELQQTAPEPAWLKSLDAQPEAAAEARRWRQAALDAAALDADYFSTAPGARTALAARLHQTDPAAFRAMLADAARLLAARDPQALAELAQQLTITNANAAKSLAHAARNPLGSPGTNRRDDPSYNKANGDEFVAQVGGPQSGTRPEGSRDASEVGSGNAAAFPAEAYRAFATATNDDVERQVRDSIDRTLGATLPDGVADGARRRIGDDIFRDLNATLSADRDLSANISELLRGHRFDAATRQHISSLLAGRARLALPEIARRVVSEWTSSVLASDRARQARIDAAVSRRDITGGRLPEPVAASALLPRRVDYARTTDEQILEM